MTLYKLYGYESDNGFYIGKMNLQGYLWYLNNSRRFNKELAIAHTKKIYNVDLTDILNNQTYYWDYKQNNYEAFTQSFNSLREDDGTRNYFNSHGRRRYERFMSFVGFNSDDCLSDYFTYSDIHHIFPLGYGGKNNIENLIHLSNFHHDLLHQNPLELNETCCHMAVDYLGYLYHEVNIYKIIVKYELAKYSREMIPSLLRSCIEEEMRLFYKDLTIHR